MPKENYEAGMQLTESLALKLSTTNINISCGLSHKVQEAYSM